MIKLMLDSFVKWRKKVGQSYKESTMLKVAPKKLFHLLLVSALFILMISCQSNESAPDNTVHDATQDMIDELKQIALDRSNIQTWHLNRERMSPTLI